MRAPRRVPWASKVELSELYELLFSPSADHTSRQMGLARMSIYISSPSCPSFIHLLHSLVAAELLPYPPRGAEETQRSRMIMAMAVVRFVNGMVDPLQTGPYARPISHIAASLGIPSSLIALRHRATHEDLPPLNLLHHALGQAITYIHHNSFLPLLASTSTSAPTDPRISRAYELKRTRVDEYVKRWKRVSKVRLREKEVREEDPTGREIRKIKKDLEVEDGQIIVQALCTVGALVPLARKKRPNKNTASPTLASLQIWHPLLTHLATNSHEDLSSLLANRIIDVLLDMQGSIHSAPLTIASTINEAEYRQEQKKEVDTARWGLATWFIHLWAAQDSLSLPATEKREMWKRLLHSLLERSQDGVLRRLVTSLIEIDSSLKHDGGELIELLPQAEEEEAELTGLEADIEMDIQLGANSGVDDMERRLQMLQEHIQRSQSAIPLETPLMEKTGNTTDNGGEYEVVLGWRRLTEEEWRPSPIGIWSEA